MRGWGKLIDFLTSASIGNRKKKHSD